MTHRFSTDAALRIPGGLVTHPSVPGLRNCASPALAASGQRMGSPGSLLHIPQGSSETAVTPNQNQNPTHTFTHMLLSCPAFLP